MTLSYSYEIHKCIVNERSSWEEKTASWAQIMEEEKLLFLPDFPVVPAPGLLLEFFPVSHHFAVRKGYAVDPLQCFHLRVPFPIC